MATAATALPDYLTNPNATLGDTAHWRYGKAPDYSNTRAIYEQTKSRSHEASSLPSLVENLVKNWEVEASFKTDLQDWRTIDRANYSFAINGRPPQTGEHMLKVGTYNAIIASNEYYSPATSDFASSHKTFKRMMPTFAWEVLEVYSGPPHVSFRWRHWGEMKNDYVGFNDKGEKVRIEAHGGPIDIQGVTVATVNDKVQLQRVETWFDPLEMFRQMVRSGGVVTKEPLTAPDDVIGTEQGEATPETNTTGVAGKGVNGAQPSQENSKETETDHPSRNGSTQPIPFRPAENQTESTPDISDSASQPPEIKSHTPTADESPSANVHSSNRTARTEVILPEEVLEGVQSIAEKELDSTLVEDKGPEGVYQSSGCPFLVTTADQNVLNRE